MADEFDNRVNAILDEIALEGLDGITLEGLWVRLADRPDFQDTIDEATKCSMWEAILSLDDIEMYYLSSPRPPLIIFNRYDFVDPELGMVLEPDKMPDDIYPHWPIDDLAHEIRGSCSTYYSRTCVSEEVQLLPLNEVVKRWGNSLVLVASQQVRESALMGQNSDPELELTIIQYCLLERIGRSRYLGEVTQGRISLQVVGEEPKALFYHRKFLTRHGLIIKQIHHQKAGTQNCSGSLLHLPRFYVERRPKVLYLTERVVEILKSRPNYIAEYEEIRKELAITNSLKKLFQTLYFQRFIRTDLRLPYRVLYPDAKVSEWKLKANDKEKMIRVIQLIDPNTDVEEIAAKDDDLDFAEDDDVDDMGPTEDFRMALNRGYLYQAYECMVSGGAEGFSQMELSAKLGVTKLHSRTVSRNLLKRGIVSTFMNDVGRQRVSRFRSKEFCNRNFHSQMQVKFPPQKYKDNAGDSTPPLSRERSIVEMNVGEDKSINVVHSAKPTIQVKPLHSLSAEPSLKSVSVLSGSSLLTLPPKKRTLAQALERKSLSKRFKPDSDSADPLLVLPHSAQPETTCEINPDTCSTESSALGHSQNKPLEDSSQTLQPEPVKNLWSESRSSCSSPQLYPSSCSSPDPCLSRSNSPDPFSISSQVCMESEQRARSPVGQQNLLRWVQDINENAFDGTVLNARLSARGDAMKPYYDHQRKDSYCMTYRIYTRINLILEYVTSQKVIDDYSKLLKLINEEEEKEGLGRKIDKKSLLRLIFRLKEDGYLNLFTYILTDGVKEKVIFFICDKSVCFGHSVIQSSIEQAKMKMFIVNKENIFNVRNTGKGDPLDKSDDEQKMNIVGPNKRQKITFVYDKKIGKKYGLCPKFIRMRTLHQFLFYLIYGYEGSESCDQKKALDYFAENDVIVNDALISEMPKLYVMDLHWKMFIPPLQSHAGWPHGWTIMCDILLRLPLSIFVKIFNISYIIPGLEDYLSHPVRKHFLVKHLPVQLRNGLTAARKYIFSIHEVLTRLCYIGLIQFGPQRLKEKDQVLFFLNRRASLLDTVPSKPGYHQVSNENYEQRSYEFNVLPDVDKYWYEMWNICLHTQLGGRMCVTGKDIVLESLQNKPAMLNSVQSRNPDEAPMLDVGEIPGDKKGAGGLDSAIFSHLKRNWNWTNSHNPVATDKNPPLQGMDKRRTRLANVKCAPVVFTKYTGIVKKSINYLQNGRFSKVTKYDKKPAVPAKAVDPKVQPVALPKPTRSHKNIVRRITARKRAVSRPYYDDVDMHALRLMSKLRVEWSPAEDNLLLICKVASMYLCPNPRQQIIGVNEIRDVLHKSIPASKNKTSKACQRRILYMMKNLTTSNSVAMHLEEVRQDPTISNKFKNTFSAMRIVADSNEELEILMNEKFKMLVDILKTKSENLMPEYRVYCTTIPATSEEFWAMFDVIKPKKNLKTRGHFQEVKNVVDIKCAVVNTIINSSLCCLSDKTSWAYQLFKVYQQYPDNLLRSAMTKIRADQMVSLKKSYVRLVQKSGNYLPLSSSPYQLSISYLYLIQTKYQYRIFQEAYLMGKKLIDWTKRNSEHMKVEVGSGGSAATLVELMHKHQISFNVEIPEQVIILDPRISELDETYARIVERYRDILHNYKSGKDYTTSSALFKKQTDKLCEEIPSKEPELPLEEPLESLEESKSLSETSSAEIEPKKPDSPIESNIEVSAEHKADNDGKADVEDPELSEFPLVDIDFEEPEDVVTTSQNVVARAASRIALFMMREELEESTVGTNQHAHDFFVVNSCQVFCNLINPSSEANSENEHFILPLDNKIIKEVLESVKRNMIIPDKQVTEEEVHEMFIEEGASQRDWDFACSILAHIAERKEIGATLKHLKECFYLKIQEMSLAQILNLLVESKILLRTGVTTVHYIHQSFTHPWLAHSFNLLRLDREKLEPSQVRAVQVTEFHDEDSNSADESKDVPTDEKLVDTLYSDNQNIVKSSLVDASNTTTEHDELNVKDHVDVGKHMEVDDVLSAEDSGANSIEGQTSRSVEDASPMSSETENMDVDVSTETKQGSIELDCESDLQRTHCNVQVLENSNEDIAEKCTDVPMEISMTESDSKNDVIDVSPQTVDSEGSANGDKPLECEDEVNKANSSCDAVVSEEKTCEETSVCKSAEQVLVSPHEGRDLDHPYNRSPRLPKSLRKKLRFRTWNSNELGQTAENPEMLEYRAQRKAFVEAREMKRQAERINFDTSEKIQVSIRPWVRINGSLNRRVLDRMLGAVLGHSMFQPGHTIKEFGNRFSPALQPFHVRELIEMLQKLGCVKLVVRRLSCKTTLFSKPSMLTLAEVDGTEDESDVIVEPQHDAVLKLGQFIGNKSYARDFMSC